MTRSKVSFLARSLVCPVVATGTCVLLSNPENPLIWWGVVAAGCGFLLYDVLRGEE